MRVQQVPVPGRAQSRAGARLWPEHTDLPCLGDARKVSPDTHGGETVGRAGGVRGPRDGDSELEKVSEPPKGSEWDSRSPKPGAGSKPPVPSEPRTKTHQGV